MKTCSKCGSQVNDEDVFCHNCGKRINQKNGDDFSKKNKLFIIGLCIAVVIVILIIILLNSEKNTNNQIEENSAFDGTTTSSNEDFVDKDNESVLIQETEETSLTTVEAVVEDVKKSKYSKGDYVCFGTYEQDNQNYTTDEPIEWIVLDTNGTELFLLSKYILDAKSFNVGNSVDYRTWSNSPIREWLNSGFFDTAFNSIEKKSILLIHNTTSPNLDWGTDGGEDTDDYVFLLSIDEANKYYPNDDQDIITTATAYAYVNGCKIYANNDLYRYDEYNPDPYPGVEGSDASWWLRSPGRSGYYGGWGNEYRAAYVKGDLYPITPYGELQGHKLGIRPAIWIDTSICGDDYLEKKESSKQEHTDNQVNKDEEIARLIAEVKNGGGKDSYEELYKYTGSAPINETQAFSGKWWGDNGGIEFLNRIDQEVECIININNENEYGSLNEKARFINNHSVMIAIDTNSGQKVYILILYESNSMQVYSLAKFGDNLPISGEFIPQEDYLREVYSQNGLDYDYYF